jgi:tetratricopeptide (TPR) repeat protein
MNRGCALCVLVLLFAGSATAVDLLEVEHPDVGGMEDAVRQPLSASRSALETLLSAAGEGEALGRAFGDSGELYLVYDLTEAAAACLENASRLLPSEARWPYLLGSLFEHEREIERARLAYERALRLDPDYLVTVLRLGRIYELSGLEEAADRAFKEALQRDPGSAFAHAGLARLANDAGRFEEAVAAWERALALQPQATALHYSVALAYRELGRFDEAREHLSQRGENKVQFQDPITDEVKLRAGGALAFLAARALEAGETEVGIERLRQAVAASPSSARIWGRLGDALADEGRFEEAVDPLQRAIELQPDSVPLLVSSARVLVELGRGSEAIVYMRRALAQVPEYQELRVQLAATLARNGEPIAAADEIGIVLQAQPQDTRLRWIRVSYLVGASLPRELRAELEEIVRYDPSDAGAHFQLGNLAIEAGEEARALDHLREAVAIDAWEPGDSVGAFGALRRVRAPSEAGGRARPLDPRSQPRPGDRADSRR